jgi:transmembrane sensor
MTPVKSQSDDLEELAAQWAVRHAAGLGPQERAEFERWLEADPRHYAAFAEADLALSVLSPPRAARDRNSLRQELAAWEVQRKHRRQREWWFAFATVGLAAAAALVLVFRPAGWIRTSAPVADSEVATMTVRPLVQRLADGTVVDLNAGADITVDFTPGVRGVRLVRGEAHFTVAKDGARPFVVSVGPIDVRAVGTAFNVRLEPTAVQVLVTEGQVAVDAPQLNSTQEGSVGASVPAAKPSRAAAPAPSTLDVRPAPTSLAEAPSSSSSGGRGPLLLTAGHRTVVPLGPQTVPAPAVAAVSPAEIQRELAWRQMRFELTSATLEEAVALYNRKGRVQFAIGDAELKTRCISGIYWADHPAQFAELIESTLDLKIVHEGPDRIVLRKP